MAEDSFKTFKKRYQEGKIKTTQMPPLPPGPGAVGKVVAQATGPLVVSGLRSLRDAYTKSQKTQARNAQRREIAADKRAARDADKAARAKEKFGALVKREDKLPATQGSRALVKRRDNLPATRGSDSRALTVSREGKGDLVRTGGGRSLATTGTRTFGDKGQGGRIVGLSNKGKLALGAGAAAAVGAVAYKKASGADASSKLADGAKDSGRRIIYDKPIGPKAPTPGDDRASSGTAQTSPENKKSNSVGGTKNGPFKSKFAEGLQGRAKPKATAKAPAKATDKSRAKPKADKPLSNFERQKQRQYEKEGYGGRSMTSSGAKARVQKERGYKFKDLFKNK